MKLGGQGGPSPPVPVGVVDGSLLATEVANYAFEKSILDQNTRGTESCSQKRSGATALCSAAASNESDTLRQLLCTAWSGTEKPLPGWSYSKRDLVKALCYAAGSGQIDNVKLLLGLERIDVNDKNKTGRTALHWAARNGKLSCCEFLVSHGAEYAYKTPDGISSLAWAVWSGEVAAVKFFISLGVNPRDINRWGCGLIHWAAAGGVLELCRYLKEEVGLDFSLQNNQGHNGLTKAAWNNHQHICHYLLFETKQRESTFSTFKEHLSSTAVMSQEAELLCVCSDDSEPAHSKDSCLEQLELRRLVSAVQNQLLETDRAGLTVAEVASVNGNQGLSSWLKTYDLSPFWSRFNSLSLVCQRCHGFIFKQEPGGQEIDKTACQIDQETMDDSKVPKEFEIYYRTQKVVENDKFRLLKHRLTLEQPVRVSLVRTKFHLPALYKRIADCLKQWHRVSTASHENNADLGAGDSFTFPKKFWLKHESFRVFCEKLQKSNLLFIDYRAGIECEVLRACLSSQPVLNAAVLLLNSGDSEYLPVALDLHSAAFGSLVLNEMDCKRLLALSSNVRQRGVSEKLLVTNANPIKYPAVQASANGTSAFDVVIVSAEGMQDGDVRLNPHSLPAWRIDQVLSHHIRNLKLLIRGLKCLNSSNQPRLLYRSRGLNPIDNEAVVLAALNHFKGTVVLTEVDTPKSISRSPGLLEWVVPDATVLKQHSLFRYLNSYQEVPEEDRFPSGPLRHTMFCYRDQANESLEERNRRQSLQRCLRVTPLENSDSNCFFIAVFTRRPVADDEFAASKTPGVSRPSQRAQEKHQATRKKLPRAARLYEPADEVVFSEVANFYGIEDGQSVYMEVNEKILGLALASTTCQQLLQHFRDNERLSVVHAGIRLFEPLEKLLATFSCRWKPSQQAVKVLSSICTRRKVFVSWLALHHGELEASSELKQLLLQQELMLENEATKAFFHDQVTPGGLLLCVRCSASLEPMIWLSCVLTSSCLMLQADRHNREALIAVLLRLPQPP